MGKALSLVVFLLAVSSAIDLYASDVAGVVLPDATQVGGKMLVLNGLGLRTKFVLNIYVVGLYLERKSSDPDAILQADVPKRIVMHYLHGVSKSQIADAFVESYNEYASATKESLKDDLDRLLGVLESVEKGDEMVLSYVPGTGTTLAINGREKLTIAGPEFAKMLLSVWLGPKPSNEDLKRRLLGQ